MRKLLVFFGILCFIISYQLSAIIFQSSDKNNQIFYYNEFRLQINQINERSGIRTVVIDAGHGGKDPGCLGHKAKEKDVTLAIALSLGHYIEKNCPDVTVIYTRRDDNFVELFERAEIANKNKADLFISIHCNSSPSENAYGVETYVMGLNKSQANLNVARKENSSILLENDYKKNYGGFDPNSPEAYIIFSLYQNAYLDQSLNLASKIEKEVGSAGRFNRGVKQAGFLVIYKTTMPGMLVEAGFLTNTNEEEFLMSEAGQNKIALSIFKAFKEYKNEREGMKEKIENEELRIENAKNDSEKTKDKSQNSKSETLKGDSEKSKVKSQKSKVKNQKITSQQINKSTNQQIKSGQATDKKKMGDVVFKVQIATSQVKKNINSSQFKGLDNVNFYFENGLYKYTIGNEKEIGEAKKILNKMKEKGFKDAFIIAFLDGKRMKSISEGLNLQKSFLK